MSEEIRKVAASKCNVAVSNLRKVAPDGVKFVKEDGVAFTKVLKKGAEVHNAGGVVTTADDTDAVKRTGKMLGSIANAADAFANGPTANSKGKTPAERLASAIEACEKAVEDGLVEKADLQLCAKALTKLIRSM